MQEVQVLVSFGSHVSQLELQIMQTPRFGSGVVATTDPDSQIVEKTHYWVNCVEVSKSIAYLYSTLNTHNSHFGLPGQEYSWCPINTVGSSHWLQCINVLSVPSFLEYISSVVDNSTEQSKHNSGLGWNSSSSQLAEQELLDFKKLADGQTRQWSFWFEFRIPPQKKQSFVHVFNYNNLM